MIIEETLNDKWQMKQYCTFRFFHLPFYICHVLSLQNIVLVLIVRLQRAMDNASCEMSNDE
jgi:hypothetical protein